MFQCFDIREDLFETGCVPWEKAVKDDVPNPENESKTRTSEPPKGRPAKRAKKASGEPRLTRKTVEAYRWINNCKHHDHRGIVHFWLWKALVSIEGGRKYGSIRFWGTCLFVFSSFITHTCDVFLWIHGPMETWKSGRRVIWERVSYTELCALIFQRAVFPCKWASVWVSHASCSHFYLTYRWAKYIHASVSKWGHHCMTMAAANEWSIEWMNAGVHIRG